MLLYIFNKILLSSLFMKHLKYTIKLVNSSNVTNLQYKPKRCHKFTVSTLAMLQIYQHDLVEHETDRVLSHKY